VFGKDAKAEEQKRGHIQYDHCFTQNLRSEEPLLKTMGQFEFMRDGRRTTILTSRTK
jgi:hypothetical protein